ncbi:MAG TPA: hypothetical protein VL137_08545 [Polyangiaceae bacterium]|nr:hypothetical protein [Polyangiaceae bacterium]
MNTRQFLTFGCMSALAGLLAGPLYAGQGGDSKKGAKPAASATAPAKNSWALEGPSSLHFGSTSGAIAKLYDTVFEAEFLPRYHKAEPGPETDALDSQLADRKAELRVVTEFGDTPSALDSTPLRFEFTYNNGESMTHTTLTRTVMNDDLKGQRSVGYDRSFFFFNDKMWKIYDEYKLGKNSLYSSFDQGVEKLSAKFGSKAMVLKADEAAHRGYKVAQWANDSTVMQLVDRHDDGHLALISIQKSVFDHLDQYRTAKPEVKTVSSQVREATSGKSGADKGANPADAYTHKHH